MVSGYIPDSSPQAEHGGAAQRVVDPGAVTPALYQSRAQQQLQVLRRVGDRLIDFA
jgi:hypothetical protein